MSSFAKENQSILVLFSVELNTNVCHTFKVLFVKKNESNEKFCFHFQMMHYFNALYVICQDKVLCNDDIKVSCTSNVVNTHKINVLNVLNLSLTPMKI